MCFWKKATQQTQDPPLWEIVKGRDTKEEDKEEDKEEEEDCILIIDAIFVSS